MTRRRLFPALFVAWLFFVLATFFTVQKPFGAVNAAAVLRSLLDVALALWLALVGLGLGLWMLDALRFETSPGERAVFGAGLGLGALGLLSLAVGLMGGYTPVVAWAITLLLTAVAAPKWRQIVPQLFRRNVIEPPNRWAALYLSLTALLGFLLALLPPADWDGLFYHLTGPKLYLQAGRIAPGIDVPHFNFPALMETLFAWAMLLRGDGAAKLLHTVFALLLAALVYLTARRLNRAAGWPAVVILASMPMIATLAGWAYNDLALAFYQLAAISLITNQLPMTNEQRSAGGLLSESVHSPFAIRHSSLILSGLFAGLAMGLKYTSFVTPLVIVLLLLWAARQQPRRAMAAVAAFALPAMLVAAPWYLKNWAFTGNPVYPFLFGLFGGQNWDSFRADFYATPGTGVGWNPATLLALPWLLTLGVRDANFWDGRTGPLLLLFLPAVIWAGVSRRFAGRDVPRAAKILLLFSLAHFLFWTMGVIWSRGLWQSRLLLPGLAALVPVTGWVWTALPAFDTPRFSLSRFVNLAVGVALALTLLDAALLTLKINPLPYLTGLESRPALLTRRLGAHYTALEKINAELPAGAIVVFLWEPRSYYCRLDCRPDSILDTFPHLAHRYGSAAAIAQAWRQAGVTHVLLHNNGLGFVRSETPAQINEPLLADLLDNYLTPLFDVGNAYSVYKIQ